MFLHSSGGEKLNNAALNRGDLAIEEKRIQEKTKSKVQLLHMQVDGVKKPRGKYFNPLDSLNYLELFPGHLFPGGKIQRCEQQLKQSEATSVKLKSCNIILHVPPPPCYINF